MSAERTPLDRAVRKWALLAAAFVAFFVTVVVILLVLGRNETRKIEAAEDACQDEVAAQYEARGEADVLPVVVGESRRSGREVFVTVAGIGDETSWVCTATPDGDGWTAEAVP